MQNSLWLLLSILTAFTALALSTQSPFALVLPICYALPLLLPNRRLERDSANVWGFRLLIYAGLAALGRTPTGMPNYFYDARAFTTAGLIIGGEIILQTFRRPPKDFRFDPILIFLSGIIFLIACNTRSPHIWLMAPAYIFFTLMAVGDVRLAPLNRNGRSTLKKLGAVALVTALGGVAHYEIWAYQGSIMALGARLLSSANIQAQGANIGENPELQGSFNANASTARIFRIKGTLNDPHLRTGAFDEYVGGAWGPKLSDVTARPITPALPDETLEENPKDRALQRTDYNALVTVLRPTGGYIVAPLNAYALVPKTAGGIDWFRFAGPAKIEEEATPFDYGILQSRQEISVGDFTVQTTQGPLAVAPDAGQRDKLLEVPPSIDPRVVQLGLEITADAPTPAQKAARIVEFLYENNKYSLTFERGQGDPVSEFLLQKKSAHCQYFASSATILLRIAGIPARYASGFYAHEGADDGTTVVRGRDAHAWAEAFIDGVGWVNVEATPPAGRADPRASPLPFYQKWWESLGDNFTRLRTWFSNLTGLQIAGLFGIALSLWGLERLRQTWVKKRHLTPLPQVPEHLQIPARKFERALNKRGITLVHERPWSESVPEDWREGAEFVALYNRARFGENDDQSVQELNAQAARLN